MALNSVEYDKFHLGVQSSAHTSSSLAFDALKVFREGPPKKSTSCIHDSVRKRFEPWELSLIKEGALQEYGLLKNASERRELEREEFIAREGLLDEAMSLFGALASWRLAERGELLSDRSMRRLLDRLQKRMVLQQRQHESHEEALREEGRRAWRLQEEEAAQLKRLEEEMARQRQESERSLRAACAFLMGMETRERRDEVAAEGAAWAVLCAQEPIDRAEAERIAYENFMNTPEQVALRAEQARREAAANLAAARQMKRFLREQELFVKSCKHARGHSSFFEGAVPKKVCVSCGVRFDEALGYYVRMRGKTIAPPPIVNAAHSLSPPPPLAAATTPGGGGGRGEAKRASATKLPPIEKESKQQQQQPQRRRVGSVSKKTFETKKVSFDKNA